MRIVFMGTPDFAVASLRALCAAGHEIAAVVTKPDMPKNRGMKLMPSPVKKAALELGLPVYTPERIKSAETAELLASFGADVFAVVAFGRLLPKHILDMPRLGCVNVHGSLLPKYRGSAPVQWTVLNGEKTAGVTTMLLDEGMDTGAMLLSESVEVGEYESFGSLYARLADVGAELLVRTLAGLEDGSVVPTPQDEALASYAPPVTKGMCPVDWEKSAVDIINKIRGLDPAPAANADIAGVRFKLFGARPTGRRSGLPAGSVAGTDKQGIEVVCGGGETLVITELQAPGGKRMKAADYLRGHPLA
ncbi:MAG: methionyl-tRNA formyltransferase [Oscillospiraceae bacterium]|nr:methionyl-tRNA formyltransferase [Oscillospiraceae bacterium]